MSKIAEESADVIVAINSDDDDEPDSSKDKPIIQLFKRLINNENKQSTVLTNSQIVDILDMEFSINLWDIHELEGEIYLTIMKKYLKDWPQWEEFDRTVKTLKSKNDKEKLDQMLASNYDNLKSFLGKMLERSQGLTKSTVDKLIEDKQIDARANHSNDDNVVLEVQCSREQLNQLIFRRPNPLMNDSIFNGADAEPTVIRISRLPLEAILNWWDIKISIAKNSVFVYERKMVHELNHVLMNKNLMSRFNPLKTLPQEIKISRVIKSEPCTTSTFNYIAYIESLKTENPTLVPLLNFIQRDMKLLPDKIAARATYNRYTNKYPYVRYLYKEVKNPDISSRKYDLQLEETISPQYRVFLGSMQVANASVEVECSSCAVKLTGASLVDDLKNHFEERHSNDEPDWKCTNCAKTFSMAALAKNYWTHRC